MQKGQIQHLIWALYLPSALIAIAYAILTPILPIYAGRLTSAYAVIGIILAAESIGRLGGDVVASRFLRRIGTKRTMIVGLWVALVPIILLFWLKNIWLVMALLFISGIGHALYNIARHTYITVVVRTASRGRAIGMLGGVFRAGKFIGPLLGGFVGERYGLETTFLVFGLISMITLGFVWVFMERVVTNEATSDKVQSGMMRRMWRTQGAILARAGTGQILGQLLRQGWLVIIPLYAANSLNLGIQTIGNIIGIGAALDLTLFYIAGIIMDKFGRKWAIVPSFALQALGVAFIPFTTGAASLAAVAAFIGFSNGISSGTMMTVGSDLSPPDMRGEFLSAWRLIGDAGFVGAPLMVGAVAQAFVLQMSVLAVVGSGFGAALLFAFFVPETLKEKQKTAQPTVQPAGD